MNISGFSQEALDAVSAMLYAEPGQPAGQPCPPKPPPQPKQPPQPPQPPQPQVVTATQTDPQTQQQQQRIKKPKCTPQSGTTDHSETFDFRRCMRPDGTYYGTGGKCRKGTQAGKKQKTAGEPKKAVPPKIKASLAKVKEKIKETRKEKPEGAYVPKTGQGGGGDVKIDKGMTAISFNPDKVREGAELIKKNKKLKAAEKKARLEDNELRVQQAERNREFAEKLKKELPKGMSADVGVFGGVIISSKTKGGNTVAVDFSPTNGFNFNINGQFDVGQIKDRREQIEVALKVKQAYDAVIRSVPAGTIIKTAAHADDGKGEARTKAYVRMGFSSPKEIGDDMFALKTADGAMVPASGGSEAHQAQRKSRDSIWFTEGSGKGSLKTWIQAVFGFTLS